MTAFDTNIFVYPMDDSDARKHSLALDCLSAHRNDRDVSRLMCQVACETLAWLRKRETQGQLSQEQVDLQIRGLLQAYPIFSSVSGCSADLIWPETPPQPFPLGQPAPRSLHRCGVDTLYSEDLTHMEDYDGVTVINPFVSV